MNIYFAGKIRNTIGHLSLRAKVILVTGTVLFSLIITAGIGVDVLIRRSFQKLENGWIRDNALRIGKLFTMEADSMQRITHDYAVWTDTYNFISSSDPAYIQANMNPDVFKNLNIYGAFIYFPDGKRKIGLIVNSHGGSLIVAGGEWDQVLGSFAPRVVSGKTPFLNGLVKTGDELFIISCHSILRNEGTGTPAGCFIYVRKIDNAFLQRLSDTAGITVNFADIPPDNASSIAETQGTGNYFIYADHKIVKLNIILRDITGRNAGVIFSQLGRDINKQSHRARMIFYVVLGLVLMVSGFLAHYLINRLVLARLEKMLKEVRNVRETLDLSKRLEVREGDELDDLAGGINLMLDAIEEQKTYRDKAESEKEVMQEYMLQHKKMEAMGTLAGGIAHDFNNLLMGILGNISLVLMKCPPDDPNYTRLRNIEDYVKRGSSLTSQLLGFARGGKYEVKPTDLGIFIKESSEMFGRTRKDIHIHHKTQEGLWTVEIDRGQFEQVLLNLFVNSSHAMPDGGELYLSEVNVELDVEDVIPYEISPGRFIKITVTDTGTGMDESVMKRIFEPFFTTKEAGKGTGLGLASAYGIIRNHGGFIQVESEKGFGTTFMIYIPASDSGASEKIEPKKEIKKGNETVLLIDDEEMILDVTSEMMEELGYSVLTASGGINGLHVYENNRDNIDLVILDMIMPNFTGSELFEAIMQINPSAKILLSSGYSIDSHARNLINKGCRGFIQKPFVISELSAKIREVLDKE